MGDHVVEVEAETAVRTRDWGPGPSQSSRIPASEPLHLSERTQQGVPSRM